MNPIITAATLGLVLGGCSGILGPRGAPTCDGVSRRPLNRSMWDWDVAAPVAAAQASHPLAGPAPLERLGAAASPESPARAETNRAGAPVRFAAAASTRSCAREAGR